MSRKLTGRLEAPSRGRSHYSLRVRVNGRQRRFNLGTADALVAETKRLAIIDHLREKPPQRGGRTHLQSLQAIRANARQAGKKSRSFPHVAERYWISQQEDGVKTWTEQRSMLTRYVLPQWQNEISTYNAQAIRELLARVELSHKTRLNILACISGVFDLAILSALIASNPCKQVRRSKLVPRRRSESVPRVRATLNSEEVAQMVQWEHPIERHRPALQRLQTKIVLAHFLGLRHVEISGLRWEDFTEDFSRVSIFRAKKRDPLMGRDALDLRDLKTVRRVLASRWRKSGQPKTGLVLPAVSEGKDTKSGEGIPSGISEAKALRRLYQRAMGIEIYAMNASPQNKHESTFKWQKVRELSAREEEVLLGTNQVAPVTFHAGRNAFAQACEDVGLTDEETQKLLDHESVKVTQGYQRRLGKRAKMVPNVHPELERFLEGEREG